MGSLSRKLERIQTRRAYKEHKKMYLTSRRYQERLRDEGLEGPVDLLDTKFLMFESWKEKYEKELQTVLAGKNQKQLEMIPFNQESPSQEDLSWDDETIDKFVEESFLSKK